MLDNSLLCWLSYMIITIAIFDICITLLCVKNVGIVLKGYINGRKQIFP